MSLDWLDIQSRKTGVPRVSGDEPDRFIISFLEVSCSPRERG